LQKRRGGFHQTAQKINGKKSTTRNQRQEINGKKSTARNQWGKKITRAK